MFICPKEVIFCASKNFIFFLNVRVKGVPNYKILNSKPFRVKPLSQGIDKSIRVAQTRGL